MSKVYITKALDYTTIEGCRFETYLRYNPVSGSFGITTTRRGNYTAERVKRAEYACGYRKEKPEAEAVRLKKWRNKNPGYMPSYLKTSRGEHKEELNAQNKKYFESHKEHILARNRRYARAHPRDSRDYILDPCKCTKLNRWFLGCVGHHLTPSVLIYIPETVNKGTYHNMKTGEGMYAVNALAMTHLLSGI